MKVLGICEHCGRPYPVRVSEDDSHHVLGDEGSCKCGSREFSLVTEDVEATES